MAMAGQYCRMTTHNIDKYTMRPPSLEQVTFKYHFRWFEIREKRLRQMSFVSEDIEGSYVCERNKVKHVRFTSYNPATYPEGFFYCQFLHYVPF